MIKKMFAWFMRKLYTHKEYYPETKGGVFLSMITFPAIWFAKNFTNPKEETVCYEDVLEFLEEMGGMSVLVVLCMYLLAGIIGLLIFGLLISANLFLVFVVYPLLVVFIAGRIARFFVNRTIEYKHKDDIDPDNKIKW